MRRFLLISLACAMIVFAWASDAVSQTARPKSFASAQQAVDALVAAAKAIDGKALSEILGSDSKEWMLSGDPVQDRQGLARFIAAYDEKHELEKNSDTKVTLAIGVDDFPFPIPIVKGQGGWAFDPEQGKEEILDRRIGRNELNSIQVLLALVDAQREYASFDRNGDGLREYAAKFKSSEGQRDGLYWPTADGEPLSPLGPLVANAVQEGYQPDEKPSDDETGAYHGYHFKLLTRQGFAAPDGAYDYIVDGKMVGGFAALAYPTRYGLSGVMTFMVSHDGQVYEANLGPDTTKIAHEIDSFDPGEGWSKIKPDTE